MKFVDYIEVHYYVVVKEEVFEGDTELADFEFENAAEALTYIKLKVEEICSAENSEFEKWLINMGFFEDYINFEVYLNTRDILKDLENAEELD